MYGILIMLLHTSSVGKMRRNTSLLLGAPMKVELSLYAEYGKPSI